MRICVAQATGTHGRTADTFDSETHTAFVWDGDTLVQEIQADRSISYLYEPESFVPLAQVVSDVPASAYTQAAADALCQAREQRRAQAEQEAEALQWLELTDKAAAEQLRNTQAHKSNS